MSVSATVKTPQATSTPVAAPAAAAPVVAAAAVAQNVLAAASTSPAAPASLKKRVGRIILSLEKKEVQAANEQLEACKKSLTRAEWRPIAECIKKSNIANLQRLVKILEDNPALKEAAAVKKWMEAEAQAVKQEEAKKAAAKTAEAKAKKAAAARAPAAQPRTPVPPSMSWETRVQREKSSWQKELAGNALVLKYLTDMSTGPDKHAPVFLHIKNRIWGRFIKLESQRHLEGNLEKTGIFIMKWIEAEIHFSKTGSFSKLRDAVIAYVELYNCETARRERVKPHDSLETYLNLLSMFEQLFAAFGLNHHAVGFSATDLLGILGEKQVQEETPEQQVYICVSALRELQVSTHLYYQSCKKIAQLATLQAAPHLPRTQALMGESVRLIKDSPKGSLAFRMRLFNTYTTLSGSSLDGRTQYRMPSFPFLKCLVEGRGGEISIETIREHFDQLKSFASDVKAYLNEIKEHYALGTERARFLQLFPYLIRHITLDELEKQWKASRHASLKQFLDEQIERLSKTPESILQETFSRIPHLMDSMMLHRIRADAIENGEACSRSIDLLLQLCTILSRGLQESMVRPPEAPKEQGEQKAGKEKAVEPEEVEEPEERAAAPAPAAAAAVAAAAAATAVRVPSKKPWEKLHALIASSIEALKKATDPRSHPGAVESLVQAEAHLDSFSRLVGRFTLSIQQRVVNKALVATTIAKIVRTATLSLEQMLYAIKYQAHPEAKEKMENPHDLVELVDCSSEELKSLSARSHRVIRHLDQGQAITARVGQLELENDIRGNRDLLVSSNRWARGDARVRYEDLVPQVRELYEGVYGTIRQLLDLYAVLTKQTAGQAQVKLKNMDAQLQALAKELTMPAGSSEAAVSIQPPKVIAEMRGLIAKYAAEDKERNLDRGVVNNLLYHSLPSLAAELSMPLTAQSTFLRYSETLMLVQSVAEESLDLCLEVRQRYMDFSEVGHDLRERVRLLGVLGECSPDELALIKVGRTVKHLVRYFETGVPQDERKEKEELHIHAQVKRALGFRHVAFTGVIPEKDDGGFQRQAGVELDVQTINRELVGMVNSLASLLLRVKGQGTLKGQ